MCRICIWNLTTYCRWILMFRQLSIWDGFEGKYLAGFFLFLQVEVVKIHFYFSFFCKRLPSTFCGNRQYFQYFDFLFTDFCTEGYQIWFCKLYGNYFQNDILSDPGKWVYKICNYVPILRMLFNLHVFLKLFQLLLAYTESPFVLNAVRSQQLCTRHL